MNPLMRLFNLKGGAEDGESLTEWAADTIEQQRSELTAARDEIGQLSLKLRGCQEANKLLHEDKEALQSANRDNMAWFNDARHEAEKLRGRVSELEADKQNAKGTLLCPQWAKAQMLRKQAEAVEECEADLKSLPEYLNFSEAEMAGFKCAIQHLKGESQRLRQQADELDSPT